MTQFMQLDAKDKAALAALAEFEISDDGTAATVAGVEVEIVRLVEDDGARLRLQLGFPGDEKFIVFLSRARTLQELDIEADKS